MFLPIIKKESTDNRNFVKKAVNWALRQIGKRNLDLNNKAIKTAKEIQRIDSKSAKWVASDAIRELTGEAVQKKVAKRRHIKMGGLGHSAVLRTLLFGSYNPEALSLSEIERWLRERKYLKIEGDIDIL
ncbi:DNA alkylation repair protein [Candidatus Aerophobetes bacterium]|nr:DNA alkylation repair protein [Candidatus Aerophobetes bacterium]